MPTLSIIGENVCRKVTQKLRITLNLNYPIVFMRV